MPEIRIINETDRKATVVCLQRAYEVPMDVAQELTRLSIHVEFLKSALAKVCECTEVYLTKGWGLTEDDDAARTAINEARTLL